MNYSDEDGPPMLSPMMPSIIKQEEAPQPVQAEFENSRDKTENSDSSSDEDSEDEDPNDQAQVTDPNASHHEDNTQSSANDQEGEQSEEEAGEEEKESVGQMNEDVLEMDENVLQNLNGTVLMFANDEEGNQILIERNMADLGSDDQDMTEYVFQDENGYGLEDYEQIVESQTEDQEYQEGE